ncbi:MAG: ABC transporter ATP-binding protein [Armatimonadetes bacterium]|nr:ABC transporter ATP-binding protein [Armatimonadota bacterium]
MNKDVSVITRKDATQRRLLAYIWQFRLWICLGLASALCASLVTLSIAKMLQLAVKAVVEGNISVLNWIVPLFLVVVSCNWVFTFGQSYCIAAAAQKVGMRLRNDLYAHMQKQALSFFERYKTGALMARITNDVLYVQNGISAVVDVVDAPFRITGSLIVLTLINPRLTLLSALVLPFIGFFITHVGRKVRTIAERTQSRFADVMGIMEERLSGIRMVKAFGMEAQEIERFYQANAATVREALRGVRRAASLYPTIEIIGSIGVAVVLWVGGYEIAAKRLTADSLLQFVFLLNVVALALKKVGSLNVRRQEVLAGARRVFDILNQEIEIRDAPDAVAPATWSGRVEFQNVSFAYNPDRPVLDDVSFTIEPGQVVALVGPSGAGKSTVANLLPRFYEATSGTIEIDGTDIRQIKQNALREHIGIVPQETILFSGSIRENITYGSAGASEEAIQATARAAHADEFIQDLPEKYDTLVGERATKLSVGQKQRVSIARALLKDPKILILDEATSSLDAESESLVQEALDILMSSRTTLVIAHRLATIRNADLILVLDQGRIVERGTHQELRQLGGLYARLCEMQFEEGDPIPLMALED